MYVCVCMYVWMYVWMYVCMHVCMYACIYVCMYVYIYIYIYISRTLRGKLEPCAKNYFFRICKKSPFRRSPVETFVLLDVTRRNIREMWRPFPHVMISYIWTSSCSRLVSVTFESPFFRKSVKTLIMVGLFACKLPKYCSLAVTA